MFYRSIMFISFIFLLACQAERKQIEQAPLSKQEAAEAITEAVIKYQKFLEEVPDSAAFPRTLDQSETVNTKSSNWTSGFYPGVLWMLFDHSGDSSLFLKAEQKTRQLVPEIRNRGTHDLGFMLFNSMYPYLRYARQPDTVRQWLLTGASSLASRYDSITGCIKSWDWSDKWQFPVIIDNMMNLEYLFWAAQVSGDSSFYLISDSHARHTMANQYRPDFSCYHVIDYDTVSGEVIERTTWQGQDDASIWARGQAWGLYGFTMTYRYTRDSSYLHFATRIADFLLNHPQLPDDYVPYWDYKAPGIPDAPRDASAAAIMASAFVELAGYVADEPASTYREAAGIILKSLKNSYAAGEDNPFLLDHSVGSFPHGAEVDVPLIYADYYYLQALKRYIN